MRVLLDNCVDRRFVRALPGHEVSHALDLGWDKLTNGALLDACEAGGIEVLVTVDKNIRFQQNLSKRQVALITLDAGAVDLESLVKLAPALLAHLASGVVGGTLTLVSSND